MTPADAYRNVRASAAWIDRSDRLRLIVGGPDRARFLHNLTTNDVTCLTVGRGSEAFVTSPQGKTLAFVTLHADVNRLLVRSETAAAEDLRAHFQKFGLFDDVRIEDESEATGEIHLLGPASGELLEVFGITPPDLGEHGIASALMDGHAVTLIREAPAGLPGWTLIFSNSSRDAPGDRLARAVPPLPAEVFDALRIEAGTPLSGRDVTLDNLPQELGRDARAISFKKGCYLGQETVARLDALGHVNKVWRGLIVEGDFVPPPGTPLVTGEGKPAGAVTSSAYSPGRGGAIAAGFVRMKQAPIGTRLRLEGVEPATFARVEALPLPAGGASD